MFELEKVSIHDEKKHTFLITMTPSCVFWSVMMLNMSCPPTMLYSISALRPTSGSSALIRPTAPPTSVDSGVVTRKESEKQKYLLSPHFKRRDFIVKRKTSLTVCKARWAVVDVREGDADCGRSREPAHLSCHVLGLDHNLVMFLDLSVHTGQRRFNGA